MRFATILEEGAAWAALVTDDRVLPLALPDPELRSVRGIAGADASGLAWIARWAEERMPSAWRPLDEVRLGPALPDPGAVYTVGLNFRAAGDGPDPERPERPLIYGKASTSVGAHGDVLAWDRALTANVDPECELGIVIGATASNVPPEFALDHVFGYTIINDVSSRDPWLDGDQWLLGKSMPGFCPVGPWIVTPDELDVSALRLGCRLNGEAIQDGSTAQLRFGDRGDHLLAEPARCAPARGPGRDRHAVAPRGTTRTGPAPGTRRCGHLLDRGDRRAGDEDRLTPW